LENIRMAKTKAQLIAAKQALDAEIAAAGLVEADINKGAKQATTAALEAVEAKGYQQNVKTIKMLDMILRSENPAAALEAAIKAGEVKPLGKSTLDVRVDGVGGVDAVAKKYSARSGSSTTASSSPNPKFKITSVPTGITFQNGNISKGEAAAVMAVAKIYSIDTGHRDNWSKYSTAIKWTKLVADHCSKAGVEKTHPAMGSTVGAMVTFADAAIAPMLLTSWLKVQLDVFQATK
jgi:hypothetical protein